ncbi:Beta-barrel assembly machine subunit BamD [Desulfocicer vacuolatum DSM 3385]|uniref:Beta-barrel assembly machine subunit BamD n=1 Tax=Desulfocicer vacuolatum DSM 3385 TaxID=1121400 RepID=A0A1W2CHG3_9BACT|nr:outer membrane protein assembly factor BamD [Desulfocicer vacuolatum]SMC84695.1 Beta-barrel assembly machine subunit BamD [Desulfocicer vacuolatum DSM 3385]
MRIASVVMITVLFFFAGCSWFNEPDREMEKSAETLVNEGSANYKEGNYRDAIHSFTTLRDWYPFSKYAILAELKIADSHYKLKSYEEAIPAYQEFENLHPKNEAIPFVIYRIGMCWYKKIRSVDKDQTPAAKAMAEFQRLMERFPQDPLSVKAAKKIKRCRENLAGHEAYVADYYLKIKQYKAALKRYESILAIYPETKFGEKALEQIALCKKKINKE